MLETGKLWCTEGRLRFVLLKKPESTQDCRATDDYHGITSADSNK